MGRRRPDDKPSVQRRVAAGPGEATVAEHSPLEPTFPGRPADLAIGRRALPIRRYLQGRPCPDDAGGGSARPISAGGVGHRGGAHGQPLVLCGQVSPDRWTMLPPGEMP